MIDTQEFSALVRLIYEASLDSSKWAVFITALAARLNSPAGAIYVNDFGTRAVKVNVGSVNCGFDPGYIDSFESYYGARNVWLEDPRLHREGMSVTDEMLYPPARLKATEYWTDWLRPQDMFHTAAAIVEKRNNRSVNLALLRSEQAGPYTACEMAVVRELVPHLQTAFAMVRKLHTLETLARGTASVLEAVPLGIVLVGADLSVLHANELAKGLTQSGRLMRLTSSELSCVRSSDEAKFRKLLTGANSTGVSASGSGGGAMRIDGLDGQQLQIFVAPIPSWTCPFGTAASAAVFLTDPAAIAVSLAGMLTAIYGMTPAEAGLTEALISGHSPAEYAARRGVSINTVRTQIKTAAAKVGASRQGDLVRRVLSGPAVLRPLRTDPVSVG